jgi:mRNA-degrading endonuclease HigB of HigAB toxin-antitoxin module
MRLIGRQKLQVLSKRSGDAAKWVANWTAEMRDAHWKRDSDVAGQFPRASQQGQGRFLFPVPQCQAVVHVLVLFSRGLALVLAIEFIEPVNGN